VRFIELIGEEIFGLEVASLFAEPLNVGFGLFAREVNLLTNPCDARIVACWLDVNDKTLLVGCTNDPPIRQRRIGSCEQQSADGYSPPYTKDLNKPPSD
jgi:hypothetical protein